MKHKAVQNFWKYVGINLKSESDKQMQGPRTAPPLPPLVLLIQQPLEMLKKKN